MHVFASAFSAVATYRIVCRSMGNPLYLMKDGEDITGTTVENQATTFFIEQECATEFAIRNGTSAYIVTTNKPRITTQNITKENTRISLKDPLQKKGVAVDTDNWIRGNRLYFLRCGGGKLYVEDKGQNANPRYPVCVQKSSKAHNNTNSFMLFRLEHAV